MCQSQRQKGPGHGVKLVHFCAARTGEIAVLLWPNFAPPYIGKLSIHLEGALAQLLVMSLGPKNNQGPISNSQATDYIDEIALVAGGRNRRNLPLL